MKKSKTKKRNSEEPTQEATAPPGKRRKVNKEIPATDERPKSKKELRMERKAAQKEKPKGECSNAKSFPEKLINKKEAERQRIREERREERRAKKQDKERALEARFQEQDLMRKERQAGNEKSSEERGKQKEKDDSKKAKKDPKNQKESEDYAIYKSIFKNSQDPTTGATNCRLGVKYIDKMVGSGPPVRSKSLLTVKYQLRGGSPNGVLIDSSKKFMFRMGKGEVVQGWEIGLEGMRVGGVRQLIVPPKAGYGAQDIGGGPGAVLYFKVTLLEVQG